MELRPVMTGITLMETDAALDALLKLMEHAPEVDLKFAIFVEIIKEKE